MSGDGSTKELPRSNVGHYIQLFGLLLTLGVVSSSYMKKEGIGPYSSAQADADGIRNSGTEKPLGVSEKRAALAEKLRPALVSVTTAWGKGDGFFLRENFIITSRHCVEPDKKRMTALQERIERNKKLLVLEEEKLVNYHARLKKMRKGHAQDELRLLISEREKYLADFRFRQEQDEQRLALQKQSQEHPDIRIMLADGSEQTASLVKISPDYDLALLRLAPPPKNRTLPTPPPGSILRSGDLVVILGSSAHEKVATHFFSGYRRIGVRNQMYLQVNTVIPQHKSGGPVLDAAGYVRGVATGSVGQEENAGFAIPIERVLEEFAAALQV